MNKKSQTLIIVASAILILLIFFGSSMFYIIQPGEKAVIFRKFTSGLDKENLFETGFHIIAPWNELITYDVREQRSEETLDVLDKNGLTLQVDVFVRYNPKLDRIGYIHEEVGTDYVKIIIVPEVRSAVRRIMGKYAAEEIYSTRRAEVENELKTECSLLLGSKNIFMQELLIRSITLPVQLKQAIEMKLQQEQEALAYQFRLDREVSEAERRRIEAEGIAAFNRIINASLTDRVLQQRGIEATIELAKSTNSKVIVIGSGKDGMPLILSDK
ncbi:MAG: prohibitin family protein [Bacteroidales bacterium]|nr:prohibitin family protein [Bacteroidales bacterium]